MGWFERRFVRPTHLQVIEALVQATREANEGSHLIQHDREFWDALLGQIRTQLEGFQQWYRNLQPHGSAGVVGLAWWTDCLTRLAFSPCGRWGVGMGSGRLVHRWDPDRPGLLARWTDPGQRRPGGQRATVALAAFGGCVTRRGEQRR